MPSPWFVLPVELLQGLTFALAWSAGTVHVKRIAPPRLRGTVQSIFSGLYTGVGEGPHAAPLRLHRTPLRLLPPLRLHLHRKCSRDGRQARVDEWKRRTGSRFAPRSLAYRQRLPRVLPPWLHL